VDSKRIDMKNRLELIKRLDDSIDKLRNDINNSINPQSKKEYELRYFQLTELKIKLNGVLGEIERYVDTDTTSDNSEVSDEEKNIIVNWLGSEYGYYEAVDMIRHVTLLRWGEDRDKIRIIYQNGVCEIIKIENGKVITNKHNNNE
jgi:hypothetical protein